MTGPALPQMQAPQDDARRKAIREALIRKIDAENLMGKFDSAQYQEAVEYYYKANTMPVIRGMESGATPPPEGGTPPQNDQPTSMPTPTKPGFGERLGQAVGGMVAHPWDNLISPMINAPGRALATLATPPGGYNVDPQSFTGKLMTSGGADPKVLQQAPTGKERGWAGAELAATLAAGPAGKVAGRMLGPVLGEGAVGAGLGAVFGHDDPAVGATLGAGMGAGLGAAGQVGRRVAARRQAPKTPAAPLPNEAQIGAATRPTRQQLAAAAFQNPEAVADLSGAGSAMGNRPEKGTVAAAQAMPRSATPDLVPNDVAGMEIKTNVNKTFGGDVVDWGTVDPQQLKVAQDRWTSASPQQRAGLLGEKVQKAAFGEKPDARVAAALAEGDVTKLPGYIARGLLRATGGAEASAQKVTPRKGKMKPATAAPVAAVATPPQAAPAPSPVTVVTQPEGASPVTKRQGQLKRADLLNGAPRTPDGMIDWDKLSTQQRQSASKMFGKEYRERVQTMSLAQMQGVLKPAQMDVVIKQLQRPPKGEGGAETAGPVAPVAGTEPLAAAAAAPLELAKSGVTPRKGKMTPTLPLEPEVAEAQTVVGQARVPEPAGAPAVEKPSGMTPAAYERLSPGNKQALIEQIMKDRQIPGDPALMAQNPWEKLPPIFRREIPTRRLPEAGQPVGGAAEKAAGFRRRPTGKHK